MVFAALSNLSGSSLTYKTLRDPCPCRLLADHKKIWQNERVDQYNYLDKVIHLTR